MPDKAKKRITITRSHRATICDAFNLSVSTALRKRLMDGMTPKVHAALREMFTEKALKAYSQLPNKLCASFIGETEVSNGNLCLRTNAGGSFNSFSTTVRFDPDFRVPVYIEGLPGKLFDSLHVAHMALTGEADEAQRTCARVVAACRTTEELKRTWPEGRPFWGELVDRLEAEGGVSDSVALIPISQIRKLNEYCSVALLGREVTSV